MPFCFGGTSMSWFSWDLLWKIATLFRIIWIFSVTIKYAWVRFDIMENESQRRLYDDDAREDD